MSSKPRCEPGEAKRLDASLAVLGLGVGILPGIRLGPKSVVDPFLSDRRRLCQCAANGLCGSEKKLADRSAASGDALP